MKCLASICALMLVSAPLLAAPDWTFTVTPQHQVHAKGLKRTFESYMKMRSFPRRSFSSERAAIPSSYSLRNQASEPENQGSCGSCWDFSLTGTLRDTYITAGPGDPGRLSFDYLLFCARNSNGCFGGDFDSAEYFNSPKGAPSWETSPYTGFKLFGRCIEGTPIASAAKFEMLGDSRGHVSFKDLAYAIGVLHKPVSVDVAAGGSWGDYSGGVYNACNDTSIDHMVIAEGYDCEGPCEFDANGNLPPGQGTLLIKNSWGGSWGDGGYITMKATGKDGSKCNAIATEALIYDLK